MTRRKQRRSVFGVSEGEYDLVKSDYAAMGGRSVSDFAREALQIVMQRSTKREDDLATQVRQLANKVNAL